MSQEQAPSKDIKIKQEEPSEQPVIQSTTRKPPASVIAPKAPKRLSPLKHKDDQGKSVGAPIRRIPKKVSPTMLSLLVDLKNLDDTLEDLTDGIQRCRAVRENVKEVAASITTVEKTNRKAQRFLLSAKNRATKAYNAKKMSPRDKTILHHLSVKRT